MPARATRANDRGGPTAEKRGVHAASPSTGPKPSKLAKASGGRGLKRRERRAPARTAGKTTHASPVGPATAAFPIVGIGASAGGLEALEQFLGRVPVGSGMAFVIVQHLDPTQKGIMPELLQRATRMKVIQVKDRTKVQPDCVYAIPPNKDMSILHGVLHLREPTSPRGLRLPIDFFLRSLAQDRQERSIGVILSGMGSDGTRGLRAIKEKAGVVLVQEPATAKFDGMPRSAVDAGLADIVAPVNELPGKIIAYLQRTPLIARTDVALEDKTQSALEKAVILLRARTGNDFSLYKRNTLQRRIERRMGIHQIHKMAGYVRYLQENSQELDLLFKELLNGVTNFFRDPAAWAQLRKEAIPALLAHRSPDHALRAWVPGCSTGEEAYSLAMIFKEAVEAAKPKGNFSLQIFATDLDLDAIDKARQGFFLENIAAPVTAKAASRATKSPARSPRIAELEQQLLHVSGESRATHEEMQTTQEELRSANEELQSTNEELQSTNEELMISKEEMQSLNEELQTVNTELQTKADEQALASNDLKNLLDSTDIATLFLDRDLNVRRFTPQATKIIKLIPSDVGRPITDLVSELNDPTLAADVREVLRTLASMEKPVAARNGRWFTVRIMPYRTHDDRIDGVVITFANITVAKTLEAKLRGQHASREKDVVEQDARRAKAGKREK